jgi:hypothetical protein
MKLQINITKEILKESMYCTNGSPRESKTGQNCAIGKAIYNLFGDKSWVGTLGIHISKYPVKYNYFGLLSINWIASGYNIELPEEAIIFIKRFDMANPNTRMNMSPFSFIIDIPDEVIEMISLGEIYKVLENSTTME